MSPADDELHPGTRVVHLGRPPHQPGAPVNPSIVPTSTFVAGGADVYARPGNPTWEPFEHALGELEGGRALAFGSGMAAVSAAAHLAPVGGVVVAPPSVYNTTSTLLDEAHAAGRLVVRRVDLADLDAVRDALDGADLLWVESPTNPLLEVFDVTELCRMARAAGAISVCDNTFSTPILQRPIEVGCDVVVHSVTKYLAGHSDLLMGATVTADDALHDRLHRHRTVHGAVPSPFDAWLALRGMRTLQVRMERSCSSATTLVHRLNTHPAVERLRYPGLGAVISIEVRGGAAAASRVEELVRVWTPATSLGGVESLLERRRRQPAEPDVVPENLVRLSVGIEDVGDLWRDLDQALTASQQA